MSVVLGVGGEITGIRPGSDCGGGTLIATGARFDDVAFDDAVAVGAVDTATGVVLLEEPATGVVCVRRIVGTDTETGSGFV